MTQAKEEFRYIVRIAGTDLDGKHSIPYGLSKIRGIGVRTGEAICVLAGINVNKKVGYLSEEEAEKLTEVVENFREQDVPAWLFNRRADLVSGKNAHVISADLIMSLREDINLMKKVRSYKGVRHELGLPVRGQRTRTSFRTGTSVGVSRKKVAEAAKAAAKAEKEAKAAPVKEAKPAAAPAAKEAKPAAAAPAKEAKPAAKSAEKK